MQQAAVDVDELAAAAADLERQLERAKGQARKVAHAAADCAAPAPRPCSRMPPAASALAPCDCHPYITACTGHKSTHQG